MYYTHKQKRPAKRASLLFLFANLVTNCAACFASRLARCLTFPTTASFSSFLQGFSVDSTNTFSHGYPPQYLSNDIYFIIFMKSL